MKFERIAFACSAVVVLGVFLALSTMQGHGGTTPTTVAVQSALATDTLTRNKQLVFSDDFNGSSLNAGKWSTCYDWRLPTETGCTNDGNLEQEWYTGDQVAVHDGTLQLTAVKEPTEVAVQGKVQTFEFQSGMVTSGKGSTAGTVRWAGTYGYYEARMKFGKGQGVWPAFWLLPVNGDWPPEIDTMEFIGGKPDQILQTVHWKQGGTGTPLEDSQVIRGKDFSGGWHTYGVDWEPGRIDWYIDGVKTRSYTGVNVPSQPMEIVIDLAMGGLLPKNVDSSTQFPQVLVVDYVRVYQSKNQIKPNQY
jgi:beta-glucanase (GH16 family)